MKHVTHVRIDDHRRHEGSRHKGERATVIPRDSIDRATDEEPTDEHASLESPLRSSLEGGDSRVSRVVAMVMSPATPFTMGEGSSSATREEDVVTVVDGTREALSEEQSAALARRIRLAMEQPNLGQTLPLGTPAPAPVQSSFFITPPANPASLPPESGERAPLSFKKTMLLGLPRLSADADASSLAAPSSVPSVRASVVREVGPPRTPPPRRSRRAGTFRAPDVLDADVLDANGLGLVDAELEPPDHDAFQLDHRIVAPEPSSPEPSALAPSASELSRGLMNRQAWLGLAPSRLAAPSPPAPRAALILPPPPGPRELELPEWGGGDGAHPGAALASSAPMDLPSADPFAGFIAPPPSIARRWATALVIALAVVGVFALGMLALQWLSRAAG